MYIYYLDQNDVKIEVEICPRAVVELSVAQSDATEYGTVVARVCSGYSLGLEKLKLRIEKCNMASS